jgi:hypothetical protein
MVCKMWNKRRRQAMVVVIAAISIAAGIFLDARSTARGSGTNVEKILAVISKEKMPLHFEDEDGSIDVSIHAEGGEWHLKLLFEECLYYPNGVPPEYADTEPCKFPVKITYHADSSGMLRKANVEILENDEALHQKLREFRKAHLNDQEVLNGLVTKLLEELPKKTALE